MKGKLYQMTSQVIVDRLGLLNAQVARLTAEQADLKQELIVRAEVLQSGQAAAYEGKKFRVTVSRYDQDKVDWAAAREMLSSQWLTAHTETITITKVQVKARVRDQATSKPRIPA